MQAIKWVPGGGGGPLPGSGDRQSVPMTITMTMDDSPGQRLTHSSRLIPILSVWEPSIMFTLVSWKTFSLSFSVQFLAAIYYLG